MENMENMNLWKEREFFIFETTQVVVENHGHDVDGLGAHWNELFT